MRVTRPPPRSTRPEPEKGAEPNYKNPRVEPADHGLGHSRGGWSTKSHVAVDPVVVAATAVVALQQVVSRSARGETTASTRIRSVSWLFAAKCFTDVPMPPLWTPSQPFRQRLTWMPYRLLCARCTVPGSMQPQCACKRPQNPLVGSPL